MKQLTLLLLSLLSAYCMNAQKDDEADHFLLKGSVYEIDYMNEAEKKISDTRVIIFQDNEIYAAFNTKKSGGAYEFYLPINHNYMVYYGGDEYINKIVNINSQQFPSEKKPRTVKMNMALFKPIEGYSFEMMKAPFVMVSYNPETDSIEPDLKYTEERTALITKHFKKIRKELKKKQ